MKVSFKAQAHMSLQDLTLQVNPYVSAISHGAVDFVIFTEHIPYEPILMETNSYALCHTLVQNRLTSPKQERDAQLGRWGNFQLGSSSKGVDTSYELNSKPFLYRPSSCMRQSIIDLKYECVN